MDTLSKLTIDTKSPSPINHINKIHNNKNTIFTFSTENNDDLLNEIKKLKIEAYEYKDTVNKLKEDNKKLKDKYVEIINELHIKNIYLTYKLNECKNKYWCC